MGKYGQQHEVQWLRGYLELKIRIATLSALCPNCIIKRGELKKKKWFLFFLLTIVTAKLLHRSEPRIDCFLDQVRLMRIQRFSRLLHARPSVILIRFMSS